MASLEMSCGVDVIFKRRVYGGKNKRRRDEFCFFFFLFSSTTTMFFFDFFVNACSISSLVFFLLHQILLSFVLFLSLKKRKQRKNKEHEAMPTIPEQAAAPPGMFDAFAARMRAEGRALGDRVFGTRTTTVGAALQLPRKAPLRIEPKTYFGE